MGTITEKLQYTKDSVDDIQAALIEKKVPGADTDELATYGDKIRALNNIKVYTKNVDITSGSWDGVTLSNSSWVNLCSSNKDSIWKYYFDKEIDISKVVFFAGSISESLNWIRISRSGTEQYHYFPYISTFGCVGMETSSGNAGGQIITSSDNLYCDFRVYHNSGQATDPDSSLFRLLIYSDHIEFRFQHIGRGFFMLKSTTPKFSFAIGYTE